MVTSEGWSTIDHVDPSKEPVLSNCSLTEFDFTLCTLCNNVTSWEDTLNRSGCNASDELHSSVHIASYKSVVFFLSWMSFTGLIGVIGNTIILVFYPRLPQYGPLTTFFVRQLATLDMIACLFVIPYSMLFELHLITNVTLCKFCELVRYFVVTASLITLLGLATERFCVVCRPLMTLSRRWRHIIMMTVLLLSAILASPSVVVYDVYFYTRENREYMVKPTASCYPRRGTVTTVFYGIILVAFAGLVATLLGLYGAMYAYIFKHRKQNNLVHPSPWLPEVKVADEAVSDARRDSIGACSTASRDMDVDPQSSSVFSTSPKMTYLNVPKQKFWRSLKSGKHACRDRDFVAYSAANSITAGPSRGGDRNRMNMDSSSETVSQLMRNNEAETTDDTHFPRDRRKSTSGTDKTLLHHPTLCSRKKDFQIGCKLWTLSGQKKKSKKPRVFWICGASTLGNPSGNSGSPLYATHGGRKKESGNKFFRFTSDPIDPARPMIVSEQRRLQTHVKYGTMLFGITLIFIFSWLPFWLQKFGVLAYNAHLHYLFFVNHATNFLVYLVFNKRFRDRLSR